MRAITNMMKKDIEIKWGSEAKKYFSEVKVALTCALILTSPNFAKDFMIFPFASEHTIVAVLLQKNKEGHEQSITFFSRYLRDVFVKYNIMEKQVFSLLKAVALKDFRLYIICFYMIAFVPSAVVKYILT